MDPLRSQRALPLDRPDAGHSCSASDLRGQSRSAATWNSAREQLWPSATHLRFQRESLRLFSDARALLDQAPTGISLALVTNGASDSQRAALRVLGIEQRFAAVIISGEIGVAKPDARPFGLALETLGVGPRQAWHVGDSLSTDVAGAKAAGLTAVWLNRDGLARVDSDPRPDAEIGSLAELDELRPLASY
jgi:HAD superfamily hydrolase (TIGR01549 family)